MKKLLITIGVLVSLLSLSACNEEDEIMEPTVKAKKELEELKEKVSELEKQVGGTGESKKESTGGPDFSKNIEDADSEEEQNNAKKNQKEETEKVAEVQSFIKLDPTPADKSTIKEKSVKFTGTVSTDVTKIVVTASSENSYGKIVINDKYQLKNFKPGDKTFYYNANVDWENMTMGNNFYKFEAFFEDGSTKSIEITIYHPVVLESFILLTNPKTDAVFKEGSTVEFRGTVSADVEKIVATARGDGFNDVYQLKNFKAGDAEFVYRASEKWGNIGVGANDYKFEVFFTDGGNESVNVRIFYHGEVEDI